MGKKRISRTEGKAFLADLPGSEAMAVRYLLQQLEDAYPGGTIELRVPPFGAVQILGGLNHRRGTPPNVVETDPSTFLSLVIGATVFQMEIASGKVRLSGVRAEEVAQLLPLSPDMY